MPWRGSSGCPSRPVRAAELRKDAGRLRRRRSRHWSVRRLAPIRERSSWHAASPRRHPQTPRRCNPRISMIRPGSENSSAAWAPKIESSDQLRGSTQHLTPGTEWAKCHAWNQPRRGWKAVRTQLRTKTLAAQFCSGTCSAQSRPPPHRPIDSGWVDRHQCLREHRPRQYFLGRPHVPTGVIR